MCDVSDGLTLVTSSIRHLNFTPVEFLHSLSFSPGGQKLVAGFGRGMVKVWDFTNGAQELTFRGHDWQVNGAAFLPDGRSLVSASREILVWDLASQTYPC